jgi:23S rRNA (adenine2503-C2)-methyltransferase
MTSLPDIRDLSLEELEAYLKSIAAEPFRSGQIFQWIYQKGAWGFDAMTNISSRIKGSPEERFYLKGQ